MAGEIERALTFMKAIGADPDEFHRVDFHSSHEALLLEYEHAMTRIDSRTAAAVRRLRPLRVDRRAHPPARRRPRGAASATSATRSACKLGPTATPDEALALAARLNPDNEPGRLTFITRFGAGKIRDGLPPLVEKVTAAGVQVAWVCDPMHGNTFEASLGLQDPSLRRRASTRSRASSTCTARSAPGPAGCTSS